MEREYLDEIYRWCKNACMHNDASSDLQNLMKKIEYMQNVRNIDQIQLKEIYEEASRIYHFNKLNERIEIGEHSLPSLPYPYNALEPVISKKIMELHHDKHHKSYVDGLNKAEKELQKARNSNDYSLIKHWERELAFHGSGHYLHTLFWYTMSPNGGGKPQGKLLAEIVKGFGSFENFKRHFSEAAKNVEGVGWALLVWSARAHRLGILQAEKHQNLTQWDTVPLLVLDVWEHAYYLQYENDRSKYIQEWWKIVNWDYVEKRFEKAMQLKWKAY
ncbi:superoxide dismutase [Lottiidibacillus patelloidae]|uniref:superoxide dismutase n=1 Tax=Lottiidibacillus patelloidae TaxID=2670334 RepID=A0A263BTV7_9BACI|nr:superoxide dismutase [Lottiidibacillus patelloidae]OZM57150.1 superoxide dismutase [Lottiidibacillus patelloidae]